MALTVRIFVNNRLDFPTIKKEVVLLKHSINWEAEEIIMYTRVLYYDENNVDITYRFKANEPVLTATNAKIQTLYAADGVTPLQVQQSINGVLQVDDNNNPIMINSTIGEYDYLIAMVQVPVTLSQLYIQYILINDAKGNFSLTEQ